MLQPRHGVQQKRRRRRAQGIVLRRRGREILHPPIAGAQIQAPPGATIVIRHGIQLVPSGAAAAAAAHHAASGFVHVMVKAGVELTRHVLVDSPSLKNI